MRFFLEFTTINYKMRHALVMELSRIFPGSAFAGCASSYQDVAYHFLCTQKDIQYQFIDNHRDLCNRILKEEPDYKLLKQFEETLPEKSLWRFIAMDREWGYQFCKGVYMPASYIQTINTQDNILRTASGLIKYYQKVIEEFKPDVFIPANGQNSMSCPIIDQVCQNMNVLILMPETIRTLNYMVLTDNRQYIFTQVDETCRQLMNGALKTDMSSGEKCYQQIMSDKENQNYFNISRIDHFRSRLPWLKFVFLSLKSIMGQTKRWFRERRIRASDTIFKQPRGIKTSLYNIFYAVLVHYRRVQLMNPKFYHAFHPDEKYVYFPLHSSNEYSTQVQGTMWINQLQVIEMLAKSIPHDWKVVVKEHPGILLWRVRPMSFYKEIKSYANVRLLSTETSSNALISRAQMIVTIVGTTGWEAIMRGKAVISFRPNMFDVLGLNRMCTDVEELSTAIYEEVERIKKITSEERRRRIICLLTAITQHGFWIDEPCKLSGDQECCSWEERHRIVKPLAKAYKDYLAYRGLIPIQREEPVQV